jgi:hypothetical protein
VAADLDPHRGAAPGNIGDAVENGLACLVKFGTSALEMDRAGGADHAEAGPAGLLPDAAGFGRRSAVARFEPRRFQCRDPVPGLEHEIESEGRGGHDRGAIDRFREFRNPVEEPKTFSGDDDRFRGCDATEMVRSPNRVTTTGASSSLVKPCRLSANSAAGPGDPRCDQCRLEYRAARCGRARFCRRARSAGAGHAK